ncbi:uncharacterized protein LOC124540029 isoform X2 [Vanessa cardui]|uniref:uncharacterized protein LOC124540029 isoform X2 n=1 Tax=Vanessa cardui TaxID=171605 RepID=UPI001F137003|nr:uncharacterized protein LOC124540029 isoform X2 [Vanessa cardui]
MKWVVVASFIVCLATLSKGSALRSTPQSKDAASSKYSARREANKLPRGLECLPGSRWKSKCNGCTCSEDGHPVCTDMACPGQEDEPELTCAPDTAWKIECNTCTCSPEGRAMCTRMGCGLFSVTDFDPVGDENEEDKSELNVSLNRRIRATSQGTPKACQPGQEFRMDCNKCLCNNEGQDYSCTRIDCLALNSNGNSGVRTKREVTTKVKTECEPGSVFNQGCNPCRCTDDGNHATCALKRCKEDANETDKNLPESDPSFRCNPGEQYKRDCNDCTCSADGKSVFCTLRFCDQDLAPTI